jgi:outer membrane protein assembly factor BamB
MQIKMTFGEGSSAALHGNTIVVMWDHEAGSFIAAFDKTNGKELWRKQREEATSWSTPLIVDYVGKTQIITAATKKIRSYDFATGDLIWECSGLFANAIPSPVTTDGLVYCMSGFQGNALLAIKLGRTGDLTGTDAIVWKYNKSTPYVPSPLLYGNRLYFLAGNNGMISCFDAKTGKQLIDAERLEAIPNVYASPIGANGRVYLPGRNGVTVVIKDAEKFEILATNKLDDGFDASPVAVGKELFLRGHENLYCIAEK